MFEPSRNVVTRSHAGVRNRFPSRKMGRMIGCESLLEREAARLFELHPFVTRYVEQPPQQTCYDAFGKAFGYTPDFFVEFSNRTHCYVEIKPAKALRDPELVERLSAVERSFEDREQPFRLLTDRELRAEPRAKSLRRIRSESKTPLSSQAAEALIDQLGSKLNLTIGEAKLRVGEYNVMRLIAAGRLHFDFNKPLVDEAFLYKSLDAGASHDAFLI